MKKTYVEVLKQHALYGIGTIIGLGIMDWIKKNEFSWSVLVTRVVVIVLLYILFSFVEYKCQK